jgi:hypothetical protein
MSASFLNLNREREMFSFEENIQVGMDNYCKNQGYKSRYCLICTVTSRLPDPVQLCMVSEPYGSGSIILIPVGTAII